MKRTYQFIAFVFIALAVSYGTQRYLETSQQKQNVALCHSLNYGRKVTNQRVLTEITVRDTVEQFAKDAAVARYAAWHHSHQLTDFTAARDYRQAANKLASVHFTLLAQLKCPT